MTINKSFKLIKNNSSLYLQYNQVLSNCSPEIKHPNFNSIFFWTDKKYKIDHVENLVSNGVFSSLISFTKSPGTKELCCFIKVELQL